MSGCLELGFPKLIICVAAAGRRYSMDEPIVVDLLLAMRLNVLSMLRASDAKQLTVLELS